MDLEDYGIDLEILQTMYEEWLGGAPKSALEQKYLGKPESHGKVFTGLVRRHLGIETERSHPLVKENRRLILEIKKLRAENAKLRNQLRLDV